MADYHTASHSYSISYSSTGVASITLVPSGHSNVTVLSSQLFLLGSASTYGQYYFGTMGQTPDQMYLLAWKNETSMNASSLLDLMQRIRDFANGKAFTFRADTWSGVQTYNATSSPAYVQTSNSNTFTAAQTFAANGGQIVLQTNNTGNTTTVTQAAAPASSQTLTMYDFSASSTTANLLAGIRQIIPIVENAATTLTAAQSGCIMFCPQSLHANSSTINVINLPALTAGWNCKVIFAGVGNGTSADGWQITGPSACMLGFHLGGPTTGLTGTDAQTTNKTSLIRNGLSTAAFPGDYAVIECDGTKYWVSAFSLGGTDPFTFA